MLTPGLSPVGAAPDSSTAAGAAALVPGLSAVGMPPAIDGGTAPGLPAATAILAAVGPLGALDARAVASAVSFGAILGPLGALSAAARHSPAYAADLPPGVTYYQCVLTGAPDGMDDADLPIRSFQVRHRRDTASYYQIVIPSIDYIDAIDDRPNGQIVIWSDTDGVTEELMRGALGDVRSDRGPNNQAITISGNASRAATPLATYRVSRALYQYSTFDGEQRLRIEPRAGIRPGDTVQFEGSFFTAGVVSWSVAASGTGLSAQMEVATLSDMES